jgi:hypothetical protein
VRRWGRRFSVLGLALALLLASAALLDLLACREARAAIEAFRAERARAGDPLDEDEPALAVSSEQDAAPLYSDALFAVVEDRVDVLERLPDRGTILFGEPAPVPDDDEADAFIAANERALALAAEASKRPFLRVPPPERSDREPLELTFTDDAPPWQAITEARTGFDGLAKRACLRALRKAERGDGDGALADVALALAIARAPVLPPGIPRIDEARKCEEIAFATLGRVLGASEPGAFACRRLAGELATEHEPDALARWIEARRREAVRTFRRVRAGDVSDAARALTGGICLLPYPMAHERGYDLALKACPWILDRDELLCLDALTRARDVARAPSRAAIDELEPIERRVGDAPEIYWVSHWEASSPGMYALPGLGESRERLNVLAWRETARAALLLRARRIERRAYPLALDELGERLVDPWSGAPLRYEPRAAGFRVWSVGRDARDDGIIEWSRGEERGTADVAFELAR